MNAYQFWQDSIAGKKPPMFVDDPRCGFYRKSISERNEKGNSRRVGWEPVAVFMDGDVMVARVGEREVINQDKLNELWTWVAGNAISEEWYRIVAEEGKPWPDAHDPSRNKISSTPPESAPPALAASMYAAETQPTPESPEAKLAREITEARAGLSQYAKIDSDTMAGQALSLKNTITTLAGDLNKHREALVRPHIDAQREVNDRLNPIINSAKADASALLKAIGGWEDVKREAARQAQAKADREAAEHAAKVKAAEEAGKPAPAPPPAAVAPNAPAPSSQVAAAVGRKASVKVKDFIVSIDEEMAFKQFKGNTDLSALLMTLAQKAIDAGVPVPGAVTESRSIVR